MSKAMAHMVDCDQIRLDVNYSNVQLVKRNI